MMEAALASLVDLVAWLTVAGLIQELAGKNPQPAKRQKSRRKK